MKSMAVLLLVIVLIAGVAVSGSRAQPLRIKSVAFDQCHGASPLDPKRCIPVLERLSAAADDGDAVSFGAVGVAAAAGGDGIDPERNKVGSGWVMIAVYLAEKALEYFQNNQYFPGNTLAAASAFAGETVFDPVP